MIDSVVFMGFVPVVVEHIDTVFLLSLIDIVVAAVVNYVVITMNISLCAIIFSTVSGDIIYVVFVFIVLVIVVVVAIVEYVFCCC